MVNIIKLSSIILSLIVVLALASCKSKPKESVKEQLHDINTANVTVDEAKSLLEEKEDLVVLDVRTDEEYRQGHLKNALLIPYDELDARIGELEQYNTKPILVYCRTGRRSSIAVDILSRNGFTNIYHMNEGISEWKYTLEK